jgi:hypothetical protein
MHHMNSRLFIIFYICLVLVGCVERDAVSSAIARQFAESKGTSVNLTTVVTGNWDKVCVLGPYSNNDSAKRTLGFEWNAESKTSIRTNEGISLLLFVSENKVISYVEHKRSSGDFSNLTTQCFPKEDAQFVHDPKPAKGWPGLFAKNLA